MNRLNQNEPAIFSYLLCWMAFKVPFSSFPNSETIISEKCPQRKNQSIESTLYTELFSLLEHLYVTGLYTQGFLTNQLAIMFVDPLLIGIWL
jgi:hypothetical protein